MWGVRVGWGPAIPPPGMPLNPVREGAWPGCRDQQGVRGAESRRPGCRCVGAGGTRGEGLGASSLSPEDPEQQELPEWSAAGPAR